jgi:hypothetical protein
LTEEDPAGETEARLGQQASFTGAEPAGTEDRDAGDPDGRFARRTFLGGAAGLGMAFGALRFRAPALAARLAAEHKRLLANPALAAEVPERTPDFTLAVERDTDLLLLDFAFYGYTVDTHSNPRRLVPNPKFNVIVVQFPPQAIGEATYLYPASYSHPSPHPIQLDPAPVLSDVSGPSRLSFSLYGSQTIPLPTMTAADLLDWRDWTLNISAGALAFADPGARAVTAPTALQTWVECPYALILSPVVDARPNKLAEFSTFFSTRPRPLTASNVTDCWGARLSGIESGTLIKPSPNPFVPAVAAVWATDYDGASKTGNGTNNDMDIVYDP